MLLPLSVDAGDDKHGKYKRRLFLRGARWLSTVIGRTLLLCLIPMIASLFNMFGTGSGNPSGKEAGAVLAAATPPFFSQSTTVLVWWILSSVASVIEILKASRVKTSSFNRRVPFLHLLISTYFSQVIVLVFISLVGGRNPELSTLKEFTSDVTDRVKKLKGRMRGAEEQKSQTKKAADNNDSDDDNNQGVQREQVPAWIEEKDAWNQGLEALDVMKPTEIVEAHLSRCYRGIASIILVCHNEQKYMTRTLDSILNSTLPGMIKEILIIDDASTPHMIESFNSSLFTEPLVKVRRNEVRQGLIRSKVFGGAAATGSILVFLDAHVKPDPGWLHPIVRHLNTNYKRVVVPLIPVLNGTSWEVDRDKVGKKMMFDWRLDFNWFEDSADDFVPCMSGGLLAITKKWWHESGELDPGMEQWGGENVEQSVRVWLCGGEVVLARDSVVAHVFKPGFTYPINSTKILHNKIRTVEVWFDEFKHYFYEMKKNDIKVAPAPLPSSGSGSHVDPDIDGSEIFANISKRLELRERLQCKPFSWYVHKFHDLFKDRDLLPVDSFMIRNIATSQCLSIENTDKTDKSTPKQIVLADCNKTDFHQKWSLKYDETLVKNVRDGCLDAFIGGMPSQWSVTSNIIEADIHEIMSLRHYFKTYSCDRKNLNQNGWKFVNNRITFGSFCLEAELEGSPVRRVFLTGCRGSNGEGLPSDSANVVVQPWDVNASQNFQIEGNRTINPRELS